MQSAANARGLRLRPHAKTHKSTHVARLQIERGAVGICCAKLGEAEVFADAGVKDIRAAVSAESGQRGASLRARRPRRLFVHRRRSRGRARLVRPRGDARHETRRADQGGRRVPSLRHRPVRAGRARHGARDRDHAGPALPRPAQSRRAGLRRGVGKGHGGDRGARGADPARPRGVLGRALRRDQCRRDADREILRSPGRHHRNPSRQLRLLRSHAGRARRRDVGRLRADGPRAGGRVVPRAIASSSTAAARRSRTTPREGS